MVSKLCRREAIKLALKGGVYAVPAILAVPLPVTDVAAATPSPTMGTVVITPPSGTRGTQFVATGSGFSLFKVVQLTVTDPNGQAVWLSPGRTDASGDLMTATIDSTFFRATGTYTFTVQDVSTFGIVGKQTFSVTVTTPPTTGSILVTPPSGAAGTSFTITGTGFPPNTPFILDLQFPPGSVTPSVSLAPTSNGSGGFVTTTVSTGAASGVVTVKVYMVGNGVEQLVTTGSFTIS